MNEYRPARARALLDLYGYTDRDGDGFRELPDGRPLTLEFTTGNDQSAKQGNELWKRSMDGIGIRLAFKRAKWPEQLKAARAGKLQMWSVGSSSSAPDAESTLSVVRSQCRAAESEPLRPARLQRLVRAHGDAARRAGAQRTDSRDDPPGAGLPALEGARA
jgi:ABC-type transport system substrate-binding protein